MQIQITVFILASLTVLGCSASDTTCVSGFPCTGDAETPATGKLGDLDAWLSRGDYKKWTCEAAAHDARGSSPHGKNRICSNAKLAASTAGNYPVGAANVKELYEGDAVKGYAVALKIKEGTGGGNWYWFERTTGGSYPANGPDDSTCTGCHAGGARDYVFTQVGK
jgi:hypothetical protein